MGDSVVSGMISLWFVAPYGKGPGLDYNVNQTESAAYICIILSTHLFYPFHKPSNMHGNKVKSLLGLIDYCGGNGEEK